MWCGSLGEWSAWPLKIRGCVDVGVWVWMCGCGWLASIFSGRAAPSADFQALSS